MINSFSPYFQKESRWIYVYKSVCYLQVTLVATAPLTNLAVAVQLDPLLPKKLKGLYIMGGNIECRFLILLCIFSHLQFHFFILIRMRTLFASGCSQG